jgi:hypothetical protein
MKYYMVKGLINSNDSRLGNNLEEIDQLAKEINEQSYEDREIIDAFDRAMSNFASDRSLETCLEVLNTSIQIANIRNKLLQSYQHYARLLEKEITRLNKMIQTSNDKR